MAITNQKLEKIVLLKTVPKKGLPTLPPEMREDRVIPLESEFKKNGSDIIRGLDAELERIILPDLIGVQATDVEFSRKSKEYWAEFSVLPTEEGLRLNIATEKKRIGMTAEGKEITRDYPVNENDYMIYQIALQSSKVASTPDQLAELEIYDFYLVDLEEAQEAERSQFELVEKAEIAYSELIVPSAIELNMTKIDQMISLLKDPGEIFYEDMEVTQKKMMLKRLRDSNPLKFLEVYNDETLPIKAFIKQCVEFGILTKEGNEYYDGEKNIGSGRVAISHFQKNENSGRKQQLESKLAEAKTTKRNK